MIPGQTVQQVGSRRVTRTHRLTSHVTHVHPSRCNPGASASRATRGPIFEQPDEPGIVNKSLSCDAFPSTCMSLSLWLWVLLLLLLLLLLLPSVLSLPRLFHISPRQCCCRAIMQPSHCNQGTQYRLLCLRFVFRALLQPHSHPLQAVTTTSKSHYNNDIQAQLHSALDLFQAVQCTLFPAPRPTSRCLLPAAWNNHLF